MPTTSIPIASSPARALARIFGRERASFEMKDEDVEAVAGMEPGGSSAGGAGPAAAPPCPPPVALPPIAADAARLEEERKEDEAWQVRERRKRERDKDAGRAASGRERPDLTVRPLNLSHHSGRPPQRARGL